MSFIESRFIPNVWSVLARITYRKMKWWLANGFEFSLSFTIFFVWRGRNWSSWNSSLPERRSISASSSLLRRSSTRSSSELIQNCERICSERACMSLLSSPTLPKKRKGKKSRRLVQRTVFRGYFPGNDFATTLSDEFTRVAFLFENDVVAEIILVWSSGKNACYRGTSATRH